MNPYENLFDVLKVLENLLDKSWCLCQAHYYYDYGYEYDYDYHDYEFGRAIIGDKPTFM